MSRNNNSNNDNTTNGNPNRVRGPTSALSSFLREQGISVSNRSRRQRREANQENVDLVIGPFGQVEHTTLQSTVTPAAAAESSSQAVQQTTRTKRKKNKKNKDDDDSSDSEDDPDFSPATSRRTAAGRARVMFCTRCKARFVCKVGETAEVCGQCQAGPSSRPVRRKKVLPAVPKKQIYLEKLPSLQDICISVVTDYIEEVESFGVVSDNSFEKIAKIISRNRKLNDQTSKLFMEPYRRELRLYDCTNMSEQGLFMISQFCVQVQNLELIYCGRITNKVLEAYRDRLHHLKSLKLSGAFLITKEAWCAFFKSIGPRLESFGLRNSARFDKSCVEALAEHCPNLKRLELGQLTQLDSDWLEPLTKLEKLESLELAWAHEGRFLKTEDTVSLLSKIGSHLKELSIRGGTELEDEFLTEGLLKHCPNLKSLNLEQCEKLTSEAMVNLLDQWTCRGLEFLNISRCVLFDDEVLKAIIRHSGNTLKHLNINSLELLTSAGLESLAGEGGLVSCSNLTHLNCGFVRSMDDFVLKKLITSCTSLENVQIWGCHMLTETLKSTNNLRIIGRELSTV